MTSRTRPGFVLLVALLAIVLTGALMTVAAFRVGELGHVARTTTLGEAAFGDAEAALWSAVTSVNATALRALPVGGTMTIGGVSTGTDVVVVRTDTTIYWLVATARRQRGRDIARRRVGISATLSSDTMVIAQLRPTPGRAWVELH